MGEAGEAAKLALGDALAQGVQQGVSPGATAAMARFTEGAWQVGQAAAGRLEAGGAEVTVDTPYDLASLTKPFVAMAALSLEARGLLDLQRSVSHYVPELAHTHGGAQSLARLLCHRGGLAPWGGLFHGIPGPLGSPETRAFMLREAATRLHMGPPVEGCVYSDLGYLLVGEAMARAAERSLNRAVAHYVTQPLGIAGRVFYAAALNDEDRAQQSVRVAPTERCPWRGAVIRGDVHDENCAAYGGIAGHAGLFGDAGGVLRFGMTMLDVLAGRSTWLDGARVLAALRAQPGGGYVLGWDTKSESGSSAGARFSARSFGHLGFTGTSLWCDPEREIVGVLLTNRVHETRDNLLIRGFRPRFYDRVADAMGLPFA